VFEEDVELTNDEILIGFEEAGLEVLECVVHSVDVTEKHIRLPHPKNTHCNKMLLSASGV
jgi:hypothetical protein